MSSGDTAVHSFEDFLRFRRAEADSLSALFGPQAGRDATAEALAYGWEHWERVRVMGNPMGYLYVVGRDRARRVGRFLRPVLSPVDSDRTPWVEPGLPGALARLPEKQRIVVMLLHCYEWTISEVAEFLEVSKSTAAF